MISVVMPAYNASSFIAESIESILNQTFQNFELIIVDDGSTDNTVEIIQRYRDPRVRLMQAEHAGVCLALNMGIKASQYPWIARIDADDVALPQRLEMQINAAMENPHVVVWGTYANHLSATGKILSFQRQGPRNEAEFDRLKQAGEIPFVIHPTALFRKDVFWQAGGYDPRFTLAQDLELWSRLMHYGPILVIPEPLLLYRVHQKSASMAKFFHQQAFCRYIMARHRARIAGTPLPDLDTFQQAETKAPIVTKLTQAVHLWGQFYYRQAGLHIAEKNYVKGGMCLSLAITANPTYALPRLWKQTLSPDARRTVKTARLAESRSSQVDRNSNHAYPSRP